VINRGWKFNSILGKIILKSITLIGVMAMKFARKCFKFSLGRCSWCGRDCGFDSSISSKGMRCASLNHNCQDK
jgi:hypothetical protein